MPLLVLRFEEKDGRSANTPSNTPAARCRSVAREETESAAGFSHGTLATSNAFRSSIARSPKITAAARRSSVRKIAGAARMSGDFARGCGKCRVRKNLRRQFQRSGESAKMNGFLIGRSPHDQIADVGFVQASAPCDGQTTEPEFKAPAFDNAGHVNRRREVNLDRLWLNWLRLNGLDRRLRLPHERKRNRVQFVLSKLMPLATDTGVGKLTMEFGFFGLSAFPCPEKDEGLEMGYLQFDQAPLRIAGDAQLDRAALATPDCVDRHQAASE